MTVTPPDTPHGTTVEGRTRRVVEARDVLHGDHLDGGDIVYDIGPSAREPGKLTIAAGYDGRVSARIVAADAQIAVWR